MAGTYKARSVRGKYSYAGYVKEEGAPLYIAQVPAGSKQDELLDYNRAGYRSSRPWNEMPAPVFEGAAAVAVEAPVVRRKRERQLSFMDKLAIQAKRESKDVAACVVLVCVIMMMIAAWGQNKIRSTEIQNVINNYQTNMAVLELENERLEQDIERAKSSINVRSYAQKMGMLRAELSQSESIYIQMPDDAAEKAVQQTEEPRMEALDILLGLLNVLHIGE